MENFTYARPDSVSEACSLLEENVDAVILSGGQSVIPMLRTRAAEPSYIVDINDVDGRSYVDYQGGQIRIGCLARHADVANAELVQEHCQVLAEVAEEIGDRQVRNRGTICGSVAHADPAGDPPVLATLLDAEIEVTTVDGTETFQGSTFYRGMYQTAADKSSLITEVRFPAVGDGEGAAYAKYEPSQGAYPVATAGAFVARDGDVLDEVRVVTGAIEDGPTDMGDAMADLRGEEPTERRITDAAVAVGEDADPIGDAEGSAEFKSTLTQSLAKEALMTATERAGGSP